MKWSFKRKFICLYTEFASGWMSRGSNPSGGESFRTRPHRPWGPPSLLYKYQISFQGVKRPGRGVKHPSPFSTEVEERIELYLYSPSWPSWQVVGWILPLFLIQSACTVWHKAVTNLVVVNSSGSSCFAFTKKRWEGERCICLSALRTESQLSESEFHSQALWASLWKISTKSYQSIIMPHCWFFVTELFLSVFFFLRFWSTIFSFY
jgi:hypothetical protein